MCGVDDELAIDASNPAGTGRACERDFADSKSSACANHSRDVGVVFLVGAKDVGNDLDFVEVTIGEEGANGPVYHPCGESFFGGGSSFAFDEAAGEFSGGALLFPVFDGKGEEVDILVSRRCGYGRDEDDRFTIPDDDGRVGLSGDFARFDG